MTTPEKERTAEEWAEVEAEAHDKFFADAYPFDLDRLEFTVEEALSYEDYSYKEGSHRPLSGYRNRKALELVGLDDLQGKHVLDVGCGMGLYSVLFAKQGATVFGTDISRVGVERAREMAEANSVGNLCTFVAGEFTTVDLPPETYDVAFMNAVYHHLVKYPGVKEKIFRTCKPGGKIILADPVRGFFLIEARRRLTLFLRRLREGESDEHDEDFGDVIMPLRQFEAFAKEASRHEVYTMSFLYMISNFLKDHTNKAVVRGILRAAKRADDVLLALFPFMKRWCCEAVLYIEK